MNRVKRWLLVLAAVVIVLPNVRAVKATALIFGRTPASATSSTTSSTTESASSDENEEVPTDQLEEEVTKPPLTGIPQIDYVWDPNLPRELNGFNLSTYPFLSSVPDAEDIDFKCDGLHDGFYASIKFGCQLYHHCIYGIRHDFLCANFTAFDQKTFICHFVSEVNCKNSAKYWFRNDALYRATTTTTTTTTTVAPPPTTERQRRPMARKPLRRRRPQNDYYYEDEEYEDDYIVEERLNRRRKPPARNRYRPVYEDDYPNERGYEEDEDPVEDDYDYEQRPLSQSRNRNRSGMNRRYRNRERNNRRNLNEQRSSSRSQEDEPRSSTDTRQSEPTRRHNRDRRPVQDERDRVRERDRTRYVTNTNNSKRPLRNEEEEEVDIEYERPRSSYDVADEELPRRNNYRNTQGEKRTKGRTTPTPSRDDFEDPPPPPRRKNVREETREEERPKVRPSSNGASVFNRPRIPPKISRPVPINEKQKYDYKKNESPPVPLSETDGKEDYYDEYEDEIPAQKAPSKPEVKPQERHQSKAVIVPATRNSRPPSKDDIPKDEIIDEEYDDAEDSDHEGSHDVKPISKTDTKETKTTGTSQDFMSQTRRNNNNNNDNNDRSPIPSGSSIFQTEQQQKLRDKFRNNFRSQGRQPTEDTPKEPVEVPVDDKSRSDQKPTAEQQSTRGKFRNNYRSNVKELRPALVQPPTATDEDFEDTPKDVSPKPSIYLPHKPSNSRLPPTAKDISPQADIEPPLIDESPRRDQKQNNQQLPPSGKESLNEDVEARPVVRVVKRPFLPSRGGNPYLPRGLRPVGSSEEETYNTASNKDQLSDNLRQPETNLPPQPTRNVNYDQRQNYPGPLTTQPPQMEPPKDPLEHIYSEYDVTLNDALNPTLKPLITSRGSPIGFSLSNKYDEPQYSYVPLNVAPAQSRSSTSPYADKKFKTYVDEYEY